eukprot:12481803-Alexandrium_andersonii.AAC.1
MEPAGGWKKVLAYPEKTDSERERAKGKKGLAKGAGKGGKAAQQPAKGGKAGRGGRGKGL